MFGGDRDGCAENQTALFKAVHVLHKQVIDAHAPALVGDLLAAFNGQHRHQVAVLVHQLEHFLINKGAVGEDREDNVGIAGSRLDDILTHQRLTASQHNKADAQFICFGEDLFPLFLRKLLHRRRIDGGIRMAGITSGAVQVAAGSDGSDQKARHMQAFLFQLQSPFGGLLAGQRKLRHKGSFFGIL